MCGVAPDPAIDVSVKCREGERVWKEDFENVALHIGRLHNITPYLHVDAWMLRFRFEYLPHGPPANW
jgi:hypothetical protein